MDAGVAAVIAGIAGAGGAAVGGLCAVWGARIGVRGAADSARQQVRDQAHTAHGRWLHERRIDTYAEFLNVWDTAARSLRPVWETVDRVARLDATDHDDYVRAAEELLASVKDVAVPVKAMLERVTMVGPARAQEAAEVMVSALHEMRGETETRIAWLANPDSSLPNRGWERWNASDRQAMGTRQAFVEVARAVLDAAPQLPD
ncbi:hypothetical protein ABT255_17365 [Streptomyces mirabilis]|uniref:hypothetical protein n=1 Tax=Streptomyces mirabilis TaxID=68239 RepID=UPI00224F2C08|nr:hypothetical protein [Streptomyces mirabilis]MCX4617951.1 hypothetical protein [Streptomyces mirabilis]